MAVAAAAAMAVAGCGSTPSVPVSTSAGASDAQSPGPLTSNANDSPAAPAVIAGPWLASPIALADSQTAVVSDACAAAARQKLGEVEADLPTAVVDARGGGLFTAVLSDGGVGIDCYGKLAEAGATVDAVDRLAIDAVEPADAASTAISELTVIDDESPRTVAFGRVGPDAKGVRVTRIDGEPVTATVGVGWWAAWWPAKTMAASIDALDGAGAVAGTTKVPPGDVESRLATATWWLDPAKPRPNADALTIDVLIRENACASGTSGADRLDPPAMDFSETAITIRMDVRRAAGAQDCQGNQPFPFTVELPEPLGSRALLDASTNPPRDATKPPPDA